MKISIFYLASLLSILCVEAAPVTEALAYADAGDSQCFGPDGSCTVLKRAAEAAAEAMAEAEPDEIHSPHRQCFVAGMRCNKAKRDALALAQAIAEATAIVEPLSSKAKRNAHAAAEAFAEVETNIVQGTQLDTEASEEACDQPGGLCDIVKRAAKAAADAMAQVDGSPEDESPIEGSPIEGNPIDGNPIDGNPVDHHLCFAPGMRCDKAKRALEGFSAVVSNVL